MYKPASKVHYTQNSVVCMRKLNEFGLALGLSFVWSTKVVYFIKNNGR